MVQYVIVTQSQPKSVTDKVEVREHSVTDLIFKRVCKNMCKDGVCVDEWIEVTHYWDDKRNDVVIDVRLYADLCYAIEELDRMKAKNSVC